MDHEYWEERLQGYVDNELGPADRIAVQSHVDACPECRTNHNYFQCLKKRLKVHARTIEIPKSVEARLNRLFAGKRNPFLQPRYFGAALALAAVLVLGFLLPDLWQEPYRFVDSVLEGKVICHDCEVADRAGVKKGSLCREGHHMGLKTVEGDLWRFASDQQGYSFVTDMSLIGKQVRIYGQTLSPEHLVRIKNLEKLPAEQAVLDPRRRGP